MAPSPLLDLLRDCVVRIDCDGAFNGTGFFVAAGEILTCAHVVYGAAELKIRGTSFESDVESLTLAPDLDDHAQEADFYPLPDLALLRIKAPPDDHPCVRLDVEMPAFGAHRDTLYLDAFTKGEHTPGQVQRSPASPEVTGVVTEGEQRLLKLDAGQVLRGYSGCPALNLRTGSVCAVIESARNKSAPLGSFGVPVAAAGEAFDGLLERNVAAQAGDKRWRLALEEEKVGAAERAGLAAGLPLSQPLLNLEWTDESRRSDLLKARYGAVDLLSRGVLRGELMRWRESEQQLAIAVVTGDGGYGKTRLALEECASALRAGWTAGLFHAPMEEFPHEGIDRLAAWTGRLLIVVDYAETRPEVVSELLHQLTRRPNGPNFRILLICRRAMTKRELEELFAKGDGREQIELALRRSEPIQLDRESIDRQALFKHSVERLTEIMGVNGHDPTAIPDLSGDHFDRPLFVLTAALLWVEDPTLEVASLSRRELMLELIDRHENQYWGRLNERQETDLDPSVQSRAVAVAALLGAETEEEALQLVEIVPDLEGASAERKRKVARWLSLLYGDGNLGCMPAVAPLEPDMLAEALITREYANPDLMAATLTKASPRQLERMHAVLMRIGQDRENSPFADLAVGVYEQAVEHYRVMATADPARYREDFVRSLENLSGILEKHKRSEEAADAMREAVDNRRRLTDE